VRRPANSPAPRQSKYSTRIDKKSESDRPKRVPVTISYSPMLSLVPPSSLAHNVEAQLRRRNDGVGYMAFRRFGRGAMSRNAPQLLARTRPETPHSVRRHQMPPISGVGWRPALAALHDAMGRNMRGEGQVSRFASPIKASSVLHQSTFGRSRTNRPMARAAADRAASSRKGRAVCRVGYVPSAVGLAIVVSKSPRFQKRRGRSKGRLD
jgi:hypothetical protein